MAGSVTRSDAIPWFLIARQALRGVSLESLSLRFHVPLAEIQRHLDKALQIDPGGQIRVRSNVEINQASSRVRNDLITILQEAVDELAASHQPRLAQLPEFEKLLNAAARLFQWPNINNTRMLVQSMTPPSGGYGAMATNATVPADGEQDGKPTAAINLQLIATPPEKLAELARLRGGVRSPAVGGELDGLGNDTPITAPS